MRTTITLDADVARAVEELRRARGLGTSAAVNTLVRRGLAQAGDDTAPFRQRVSSLGRPRIPLDDIAGALDTVEGEADHG